MSEAYLMAMPIIIYNLGGEMIYVLCSRLKAQEIPKDKSVKVIHDVVSHLFDKKFIAGINKHKIVAKHQDVRQMFEKLAHSSIMRLNSTSMSKLFELMLMSLKLQILRTRYPEEMFKITLNHLESIRTILTDQDPSGNKDLINDLNECISNFNKDYSQLTPYDYVILKQTLLRFLQGKNVKVSIFIQDNLQSNNSTIYLPMNEKAPPLVNKPGVIKEFDSNGKVTKEDFIELKLSSLYIANSNKNRMANFDTVLGLNIFSNETKPFILGKKVSQQEVAGAPEPVKVDSPPAKDMTKEFGFNNKTEVKKNSDIKESRLFDERKIEKSINAQPEKKPVLSSEQKKIISKSAIKDFNELSELLSVPKSSEAGTFKLDLFGTSKKGVGNQEEEDYIEIEREDNKIKKKFDECFDMDKQNIDNNANEGEDDLLDLMDMATQNK